MEIVTLFCEIDDFCTQLEPWLNTHLLATRQRERESQMHLSEVMTILVWFHVIGYRNFKQFYRHEVSKHLRAQLPQLVSSGAPGTIKGGKGEARGALRTREFVAQIGLPCPRYTK